MKSFSELLQDLVNEPYEYLMELAVDAVGKLSKGMSAVFRNADSSSTSRTILTLIGICIGKDGVVTDLECRFLNEMLSCNYDRETLQGVANLIGNDEGEQIILQLTQVLDEEAVAALVLLAACFCAVDETISRDEVDFLRNLMN